MQEKKCPVRPLFAEISKMWILQILKEIYEENNTFSWIEKALIRINPKTLSQRLSDLQEWDFIVKEIVSMTPLKAKYKLTLKWEELYLQTEELAKWAEKWGY